MGVSSERRAATRIQSFWRWMRRRGAPWTIDDLVAATGGSPRLARHYVGRLAAAGILAHVDGSGAGGIPRRWALAQDLGPVAPAMLGGTTGSGIADLNGSWTGRQLEQIRRRHALTRAQVAEILGLRDPRTVARYEAGRVVPAEIAQRLQAHLGPAQRGGRPR